MDTVPVTWRIWTGYSLAPDSNTVDHFLNLRILMTRSEDTGYEQALPTCTGTAIAGDRFVSNRQYKLPPRHQHTADAR